MVGSLRSGVRIESLPGVKSIVRRTSLSTKMWPLGKRHVEMGWVHITDFLETIRVDFKTPFNGTPAFIKSELGHVKIPIIDMRLPAPIFVTNVDSKGFSIFSGVTEGWLSYLAWEL